MVTIVGGGFAGRIAAVRLRRRGLDVTLVDARAASVERTRLHEAAARGRDVEAPLDVFADGIGARFVQGRAARVDDGALHLADGRAVPFDQLIVATGSVPDDGRGVPGAREHAVALGGPEDAARIRDRVAAGEDAIVVGAGLTGLELATELAEAWPDRRVTLVGRLEAWSPRAEQIVRQSLADLGVVHVEAEVTAVDAAGAQTAQGRLDGPLVAWTAGMRPSPWLADSGLPLDDRGRVRVTPTLQVEGHPTVLAAGDCAGTALRMACATAMPMGCHAAAGAVALAGGREPEPLHFGYAARCVSLGRRHAVMQGTDRADAPTWAVGGWAAVQLKEGILWSVTRVLGWEASGLPLYAWVGGPLAVPPGVA
ncbi:MAG: FAD-dependent oxidoreductase [Myxococcota bacterium]